MIKLLIADDEPIIRDTLSTSIHWASLGIQLIGTAANGIEAYNIILDEYPDIVLTDIKMPGFSGLELIERIKKINHDTDFIILSGYSDFKYAQEAMRYGVRNFLLKPCNENQIIQSVKEIIDNRTRQMNFQAPIIHYLENNIIMTIINEGISSDTNPSQQKAFSNIYRPYYKYLDFANEPYELCYLFYIEDFMLFEITDKITVMHDTDCPDVVFNHIYVHNTLLVFYKPYGLNQAPIDSFMNGLYSEKQNVAIKYSRESYNNLEAMLDTIISKIRRYETIHYSIGGNSFILICNYRNILKEFDQHLLKLKSSDVEIVRLALEQFNQMIEMITDINLLKQIASISIMQITMFYVPTAIMPATEKLFTLNQVDSLKKMKEETIDYVDKIVKSNIVQTTAMKISNQIKQIVSDHLEDSNLSLKWIAGKIMFMNVDYISKKFISETGEKFSSYLTRQRIERSKLLLKQYASIDKLKAIIELVGCGNNPQYFYQIFKKETGMSPGKYIKSIQGGIDDEE